MEGTAALLKTFDIARKDLLRSFRSAFLLMFMFGIPLLVTGMFALMFGNLQESASPPETADAGQVSMEAAAAALLDVQSPFPERQPVSSGNMVTNVIGPVMGGMLIFFAFFTAVSAAQTILKEEEEGTLPRLFTTPTSAAAILNGKFLAVGLTVLVQISLLLAASALIFHIPWGSLASAALTALGATGAATGFGIFFVSLLKNMRQAGAVTGGLLTLTGMLGMMPVFASSASGEVSPLLLVSRCVPQGWAVNGLLLGLHSASLGEVALNSLALLIWTLAFLWIGVRRFRQRYMKG